MDIVETELFTKQRNSIIIYIASDKQSSALKFAKDLKISIFSLVEFPYMYRISNYYDDETIRDMTFKKYTIIDRVNKHKNRIELLEMFNKNLPVNYSLK